MRNGIGRPKIIETPERMWELYQNYRAWLKDNPILKEDYVGKDGNRVHRELQQPPTWQGFEVYLFRIEKIGTATNCIDLDRYRRNVDQQYTAYIGIIRAMGREMFHDKYAGASVGIWNQNIVAREIGLQDKQEITQVQRPILGKGKELPDDDDTGESEDPLLG